MQNQVSSISHFNVAVTRLSPVNSFLSEYVSRVYGITDFDPNDHEGFLEKLAAKAGKLRKGGDPDISTV